jgi:hypothetical protein
MSHDRGGQFPLSDRECGDGGSPDRPPGLDPREWDFIDKNSGCSFGGGIYRIHSHASAFEVRSALQLGFNVADVWPFGFDWLGRQFCAVGDSVELLEPGTGLRLAIPMSVSRFHGQELFTNHDAAVASTFFDRWLAAGNPGPGFHECVGYRVPLFLGGSDTIENLELIDAAVYWHLSSQLLAASRSLPPGSHIHDVDLSGE